MTNKSQPVSGTEAKNTSTKTMFVYMKTQIAILQIGGRTCAKTVLFPGLMSVSTLLMRLLLATAFWLTAFCLHAGVIFTSLYSCTCTNDGANPEAALVQGSDGYLYGTTTYGGTNDAGSVFKISTNGVLTTLYTFGSVSNMYAEALDGAYPNASLVQGSDGNLYGTTEGGGYGGDSGGDSLGGHGGSIFGDGTIFKISTNGILTILYRFEATGTYDGESPETALMQGNDGNFYGTTYDTAFKITTNGVLTTLAFFSMADGYPNGFDLEAALVQGSDGNFYGTTLEGGIGYNSYSPDNTAAGTVFQISTNGVLTSLHTFSSTNDGAYPQAELIQGSDGNFYGTTSGQSPTGRPPSRGTIFKISANGLLTSLHSFTGQDGSYPYAALVQGSDGSLYGTTYVGGTNNSGTVFKINPDGTGFTTLFTFSARTQISEGSGVVTNTYGAFPQASLILVGNTLYGTTSGGSMNGFGTVFSLTLPVPPQLSIIADGANTVLAWPADATGFNDAGYTLECATNLIPPIAWQTNSTTPIVIGGQDVIINPITGSQQFFRLISP
jgi:uncharacterized repeat protein (TIGR03803 family)